MAAVSSVVSHPRDPAFVTRVSMARSDCEALEQQRGEARRSLSAPRCTKWLRLATLYRSGGGTIMSRTSASVAARPSNRSSMVARNSACADVQTAAQ